MHAETMGEDVVTAATVARLEAALEDARTAYLAAEDALRQADKIERPRIGYLTHAEIMGARLAARALGRDIEASHFPRVEWHICATEQGAARLVALKQAVAKTSARMTMAIDALQSARTADAATRTDAAMRRAIDETETVYSAMEAA